MLLPEGLNSNPGPLSRGKQFSEKSHMKTEGEVSLKTMRENGIETFIFHFVVLFGKGR